jgi:hypothetical protein
MANNWSGNWSTTSATSTSNVVIHRVYTDYDYAKDQPIEETVEQWLRGRVKEICDVGKAIGEVK